MASELSPPNGAISEAALNRRFRITHEIVLAAVLAAEIAIFCAIGTNFMTWGNAFEVTRLCAEIGLLAVAMTPVIITGGIDLSVGSLMGLSAVLFGMLWRDAHWSIPLAAVGALGVGAIAGSLNALLITRLRLPPLIVTLGTYSLFRGLAEGLTHSVDNFTGFSSSFLFLGQGYSFDKIPTQLPIFIAVAICFWMLLQRSTIGRGLYAIGFSAEGALHAGIPIRRRLNLVYILSGITASLAAIIYVSHLGQAKADAGTGYELKAITAVVLGGTSIFGGRGTIQGTVLGLFAITVLENGLRLADQPAELAGILMGGLLLVTISMERLSTRGSRGAKSISFASEEFEVKNSQVAMLCLVILIGAAIVAASNWLLVRDLVEHPPAMEHTSSGTAANTPSGDHAIAPAANPNDSSNHATAAAQTTTANYASQIHGKKLTVAMMPKSKGNAYFIACKKGADEAANELNINLLWDGPTDPDPAKQSEIVDTWITRGVDVIAVAVENRAAISDVLRKAQQHGIKVITFDADAEPTAREFFVNQATPQGIGYTLMDHAGRLLGGKGEFAIITASLTAANMIEWQKYIEERRAQKYPDVKLATILPCDDKQKQAFDDTNTILNAYPDVRLIMAICSPAVPGAAEAVKQSGRSDVKVIGLGLPNDNKLYVHEGITDAVVLWNTMDLGYLTVYTANAIAGGMLKPGDTTLVAGRLGNMEVKGDNVMLGVPFTFNKENIDKFDF
ncbi:MAG TPA: substrate-binding domain-containing protein [Pirellulales bacterium]|jgi:rhamnose transport system permease protein|nr:substrate-binding domain-containing protein [Pirellulales bacterium]